MSYKADSVIIYLRGSMWMKGRVTFVSDYEADILWEHRACSYRYPFSDFDFWKYVVTQCG
jgi:hypothetical protein